MCDEADDLCPVWKEVTRTARVQHRCKACSEGISPGHRYQETRSLYDGHWETWKHCLRCWEIFKSIGREMRRGGNYSVAIDPDLNCGELWHDNFGELPPEVAALAFMLPGESVPLRYGGESS